VDSFTEQGQVGGRSVEYSVGFAITEKVRDAIASAPKGIWTKQALGHQHPDNATRGEEQLGSGSRHPAYPLADPSNTRDDQTSAPNY
jgi:hypothetical protein